MVSLANLGAIAKGLNQGIAEAQELDMKKKQMAIQQQQVDMQKARDKFAKDTAALEHFSSLMKVPQLKNWAFDKLTQKGKEMGLLSPNFDPSKFDLESDDFLKLMQDFNKLTQMKNKRLIETSEWEVGVQNIIHQAYGLSKEAGGQFESMRKEIVNPPTAFKPGAIRDFKVDNQIVPGIYTGNPEDNFAGFPGWKEGTISGESKPGVSVSIGLEKSTKGEIEKKILNAKEATARMTAIQQSFKPEYLELWPRFKGEITGLVSKFGGKVSPETKTFYQDFKQFQRKSIENINLYIKELTGAQMSEKEAARLRLAMPDPGEKWYKGDDPIEFKAKMDDVLKYARASIARFQYYLSKNLTEQQVAEKIKSGDVTSLDDIVSAME